MVGETMETSDETYTIECNDATTVAEGKDLDIINYVYWDYYFDFRTECTTDDDCDSATACGTMT